MPEIGGLSPRDVQVMLRSLQGQATSSAADICEVAPCFDPSGITSVTAANLMFELLVRDGRCQGERIAMIDHVSVPVADLAAAARFYDRVLEPLGMRRLVERERTVGYGSRYPEFWLNLRDGHVGTPDSGHHVCLRARDEDAVRAFSPWRSTAAAGATAHPGRASAPWPAYFGAFVLDPDGNKLEAVTLPRA